MPGAHQEGCHPWLASVEGEWSGGLLQGQATLHTAGPQPSTERVAMVGGRREGVAVTFLDLAMEHMARVTRWRAGVEVGPSWDLTMGQGMDMARFNC